MQTSARGSERGQPGQPEADHATSRPEARPGVIRCVRRGFTLVEVLIVLVVVGIGLGLVSLSMGHDSASALRYESERLRSALEHAAQLAQWRRTTLLWEADATGYRFSSVAGDGTLLDESDPTLSWHRLPGDVRIRVTDAAGVAAPLRLVFRASGRNDPYAIAMESGTGTWTIAGDPLNRVRAIASGR
jgi:general secretion pathway protein H